MEREIHIDILTARQLGMAGRFFDTYHVDCLNDREIGEIYGTGRTTICDQRNNAIKKLRLLMEEMRHGK